MRFINRYSVGAAAFALIQTANVVFLGPTVFSVFGMCFCWGVLSSIIFRDAMKGPACR